MSERFTQPDYAAREAFVCGVSSLSMSSAADSPVRTSASPAAAKDSPELEAVSGLNTLDSFASYDQVTLSWRTSQLCLDGDLATFSETWPRAGITRNGIAFQRQPLAPLTDEIESGLLPTPTSTDTKGSVSGPSLIARMAHSRGVRLEEHLRRQVLLPTPTAASSHSAGRLDEWGGKQAFRGTEIGRLLLSPSFVEELMGYPVGWTACEDSAMPSSRRSRNGSRVGSRKRKG